MRAALGILMIAASSLLQAQSVRAVSVRVKTASGTPVPYALVSAASTPDRIADEHGVITLQVGVRDSLPVRARRIGFRPFDGWAYRAANDDTFYAVMTPLAAMVDTVKVVARQETPLAKTGFYARAASVRKGAQLGEFISPEELDARNHSKLSDLFQGRQYSRISNTNLGGRQQAVLIGRARCAMNIVLDGQPVVNTLQEVVTTDVPQSIFGRASSGVIGAGGGKGPGELGTRIGLDDIVDARAVMGIEIYPSTANAPAELLHGSQRGSCGLVAIWTGPRK